MLIAYEPDGRIENGFPDLDILVGIISFGEATDCGASELPGVYTRVSSFLEWLEGTIKVRGSWWQCMPFFDFDHKTGRSLC